MAAMVVAKASCSRQQRWQSKIARALGGTARRSVARHGFELLDAPLSSHSLDFFDHNAIVSSYYDECAQIVQQASGAAAVFAFDHNVRSATGKSDKVRIAGGQQVQGPARVVHGDYTLTSAPQRLRDLAQPPSKNGHFALDPWRQSVATRAGYGRCASR